MTIDPRAVYQTTWWQKVGETEWRDIPSGGRSKSAIFQCLETANRREAKDLPIGALYVLDRDGAQDLNSWPPAAPHDGLAIACVCLGGGGPESRHHWYIEGRASNCDQEDDLNHRCWVRHGSIGDQLTVDKAGLTCGAGAGSFFMGPNNEWHGYLRAGKLTP